VLTPKEIVDKMMAKDFFSQWLGIEVCAIDLGKCELKIKVTHDMLNGFAIAHGGISYSVSDSALAFASNSYGQQAVSVETSISHLKMVKEGDELYAKAFEVSRSNRIGVYQVDVFNQEKEMISTFKGTVYITSRIWE